ncbi:MAG: hypothetical protein ACI9XP_000703 [Lentimonas sp.]|jgi:hypothetical protein
MKYLFFLIALILNSCTSNSNNYPVEGLDLIMDFEMPLSYSSNGSYHWKGKDYYYFSDLKTTKAVKVYNDKFKLVKVLDLAEFINRGYIINDLKMINPDSILLYTGLKQNTLIYTNANRTKQKYVNLHELAQKQLGLPLEMNASIAGHWTIQNGVVFETDFKLDSIGRYFDTIPRSLDRKKLYYELNNKMPEMICIKNPFNNPKAYILKPNEAFINEKLNTVQYGMPYYFIDTSNNLVIKSSHLSKNVSVINYNTQETSIWPIRSKYTDIGSSPRKIKTLSKDFNSNEDEFGIGVIRRIFLFKYKYYVFIDLSKESAKKHNKKNHKDQSSTFVWQVYDDQFNFIEEKLVLDSKLVPQAMLFNANNLFILLNDKEINKGYKRSFSRFSYN